MAHTARFERLSEIVRLERAARSVRDFNLCFQLTTEFQTLYLAALHEAERSGDEDDVEARLAELHARALALLEDDDELRRMLGSY